MADIIYHDFYRACWQAEHNLTATTGNQLQLALYTSTHSPNPDATGYGGLANEHAATGNYSTGGKLITKSTMTPTDDDSNNWAYFDITEDVTWASSTITARYATLYNQDHASDGLLCQFDFGSDKSSSNGNFTIQFNANGVIRLT